jgi:cobalt-precorrin 5A hydrolase
VESVTGVDNVCERAALCGCKGGELLLTKQVFDGVTVAIGVEEWRIEFE